MKLLPTWIAEKIWNDLMRKNLLFRKTFHTFQSQLTSITKKKITTKLPRKEKKTHFQLFSFRVKYDVTIRPYKFTSKFRHIFKKKKKNSDKIISGN